MLLEFCSMTESEMYRMVRSIYQEAVVENARWQNPGQMELTDAIKALELGFVAFLKDFLAKDENRYYVLELDGQWVSALRLTKTHDFYYLEALETAPECRKQGYASLLIQNVIDLLARRGPVIIRDNVSKRNAPSLATHKKCGFVIEEENGVDYLTGERREQVYGMLFSK